MNISYDRLLVNTDAVSYYATFDNRRVGQLQAESLVEGLKKLKGSGFLVLIYSFITNKTIPGRHIYAFGGNPKAAKLSGVKTKKVLFWVYVNMGFLAALAGIVFTGRLNSATPKAGNGFELDAIASCFIGGASTTGGIGTVVGAIVGGLLMGVLNNGMSIMGVSIDWQQAIKGFVLLAAVAFDVYSKSKSRVL